MTNQEPMTPEVLDAFYSCAVREQQARIVQMTQFVRELATNLSDRPQQEEWYDIREWAQKLEKKLLKACRDVTKYSELRKQQQEAMTATH